MKSKKTQYMTSMALFLAIEIILVVTPLGYIPIGPLNATTMHIPVIIAGIVLGKKAGAELGFVFGLTSLIKATIQPGITSFCFSPFVTIGTMSGNYKSLLIAFVPRILLGYLAGFVFEIIKKNNRENLGVVVGALTGAITNTVLVLSGIYIFFGEAYASAVGVQYSTLVTVLLGCCFYKWYFRSYSRGNCFTSYLQSIKTNLKIIAGRLTCFLKEVFMKYIFVRHGKTHFNEIQLKQGWCDSPLTKQGIKEIENMAEQLKDYKIDAAYTSPILRAKYTAQIILKNHSVLLNEDDRLKEVNFGLLEGLPCLFVDKLQLESSNWLDDLQMDYTGYEGENVEDVIQRHFELLNDIEKKFQGDDTILMVGHGCSLYAFIKTLLKNQKLDFPQNASAIIVNKVNNEYQLETVLNPK